MYLLVWCLDAARLHCTYIGESNPNMNRITRPIFWKPEYPLGIQATRATVNQQSNNMLKQRIMTSIPEKCKSFSNLVYCNYRKRLPGIVALHCLCRNWSKHIHWVCTVLKSNLCVLCSPRQVVPLYQICFSLQWQIIMIRSRINPQTIAFVLSAGCYTIPVTTAMLCQQLD